MAKTIYVGKVLTDTLTARTGPGLNYGTYNDRLIKKNEIVYISETSHDGSRIWGNTNLGWLCLINRGQRYVDYKLFERPTGMGKRVNTAIMTMAESTEVSVQDNTTLAPSNTTQSQEPVAAETFQSVFSEIMSASGDPSSLLLRKNMRLFGLPYQFRKEIDVRVSNLSDTVGRKFIQNIVTEAPVVTIVPGKPLYLAGSANKDGWTHAFVEAMNGKFAELQNLEQNDDTTLRYYDFQPDYTKYMSYVNIMCRTAATFLELTEQIDGEDLQSYDWKNYRWSGENYRSVAGNLFRAGPATVVNGLVEGVANLGDTAISAVQDALGIGGSSGSNEFKYASYNTSDEDMAVMDSILQSSAFVQFYVDPDIAGSSDRGSTSTSESQIKGLFDNGSSLMKELAFVSNSGGADIGENLQNLAGGTASAISDAITNSNGGMSELLSRMLDLTSNVVRGENVIFPQIYNSSDFNRSYNMTVHLKAPYGNRFAYYMDVLVPLFHLLALAIPQQTSGNTYGSPFLLKAFCEGVFTCSLGIVNSITINKSVSPESWTNDGFPSEVDVTLEIIDLYSDLTMSPQSSPLMFINNTSLIEYIATTCGLNLIQPQLQMRLNYTIQTIVNAFADIPENVMSYAGSKIDEILSGWQTIG